MIELGFTQEILDLGDLNFIKFLKNASNYHFIKVPIILSIDMVFLCVN